MGEDVPINSGSKIKCNKSKLMLTKIEAVKMLFWNTEMCPIANMLVEFAGRNVKFALEAFCVTVKTGCLFQVHWPGQERWIWHAWEKVNRVPDLSQHRCCNLAVFYCGRKCKNTLAQTGESRTICCNSCFSYCGPKVQKCVKVLNWKWISSFCYNGMSWLYV